MKNIECIKDTFEEYLSKTDYVSANDLKVFLKSPRHYFYEKNRTYVKADKKHFTFSSALYEYIMEKAKFENNFIIAPKFDRRTKKGKEDYDSFYEDAKDKIVIDELNMQMIEQVSVNVQMNKTFMKLLQDSYYETSYYTKDKITGLKIKLRPDILPTSENTILDIKSYIDGSPKSFISDVFDNDYGLSAAYYMDFLNKEKYIFAAMEQNAPFQISLYVLNDGIINYGKQQYRMGLDLLKWSLDNNYWCDYTEFEILKESYRLGDLSNVVETLENSQLINTL
jgi:hypothetical protein